MTLRVREISREGGGRESGSRERERRARTINSPEPQGAFLNVTQIDSQLWWRHEGGVNSSGIWVSILLAAATCIVAAAKITFAP